MLIALLSKGCVRFSSFCKLALREAGASQSVCQCETRSSTDEPGKKSEEPKYDAFGDRIIRVPKTRSRQGRIVS
jgi:hypothetical protein